MIKKIVMEVVARAFVFMQYMEEISTRTVRMYTVESPHLSRKMNHRFTWFSTPQGAREHAEHMSSKRKTGRILYVDLTINCFSDINIVYGGTIMYTPKHNLLQHAKRVAKVYKEVI